MYKLDKHNKRLENLFQGKKLSEDEVKKCISIKNAKFEEKDLRDNIIKQLLINSSKYLLINGGEIIDIGCGTGEIVLMSNMAGYKTYGYDIYKEEAKIAKLLLSDHGFDGEDLITSTLEQFRHKKIKSGWMLSVIEHIDDKNLVKILNQLNEIGVKRIFVVVPNKFKPIDDHTGVPLIGLLNRKIAIRVLKIIQKEYLLSENKEWDVYLRTPKSIENLLKGTNFKIKYVNDNEVYPPLSIIKKIGIKGRKPLSKDWVLNLIYKIIILFYLRHRMNYYPYLNFILEANDFK